MKFSKSLKQYAAMSIVVTASCWLSGCGSPTNSAPPDKAILTDHEDDVTHTHTHRHGPGFDHGHEHDKEGDHKHSHKHTHSHVHAEKGIHDGRIVSMGHTHDKKDVTHYHAEVMPVADGKLTLHLLIEKPGGEMSEQPVADKEIVAYLNRRDDELLNAKKIVLTGSAESGESSTFVAPLPEEAFGKKVKVVFPRVKVGGERLSFSFELEVPDAPDAHKSDDSDSN